MMKSWRKLMNFTDSVKERQNVEHYAIPDAEDFTDQTGYIQTTTKLKLTYQKPKNQLGLLQEDQIESADQLTKQQQLKESNWVVHIQRPLPPTVIFMKSYTVEASCIFENEFDYNEEIHYP
ncbi:hypothetical protein WR25_26717 [Diploscapter pachys]|uniref:Uncharacterized protein n=1 Tax=Diploscapter pachys TaxID=2018661 RepID=A0A2A2KBE0_9BILA|nr:hypothetical protein WR25_26717 [Diploscapter pachys]